MCQNEDLDCDNKSVYYCRLCGLEYCEECAELNDGYCDCESEPNMERISAETIKDASLEGKDGI